MTFPKAHNAPGQSIEARVVDLLRQGLEVDLDPGTDVIDSGLLDSLRFVEVLVRLEGAFGIEVDLEELEVENFRSARAIAGFLHKRFGIT